MILSYYNKYKLVTFFFILPLFFTVSCVQNNSNEPEEPTNPFADITSGYTNHKNISATYFYIGETSSANNNYIPNDVSAWDEKWKEHYGGVDDPNNRNGYNPAAFVPKENPFYFALPYNDFDNNRIRKPDAAANIYWWNENNWSSSESACKNQWIKITFGNLSAFAQWEDVGPSETDDASYVFGSSSPANTFNTAGLDVSPAVKDYLKLTGLDIVEWEFIKKTDVPDGPWKKIITTTQVYTINK